MRRVVLIRSLKGLVAPLAVMLIVAGIISMFAKHGEALLGAALQLAIGPLFLAIILCVVHRVVNAAGWGLVLRSIGHSVATVSGIRIWLASEACRWLPGSLWSYGSRAVLASRRGIPMGAATASLVLELLVTLAGWVVIAGLGWGSLRSPGRHLLAAAPSLNLRVIGLAATVTVAAILLVVRRSIRLRARIRGFLVRFGALSEARLSPLGLIAGIVFYALMGVFNGAVLLVIIRAAPGGSGVPIEAAITANAVAWLAGFLALFAPGGLVVREACLVGLLSPWMPTEQAVVVALAWRLAQIVAEVVCFAAVAATGLPEDLKRTSSRGRVDDENRDRRGPLVGRGGLEGPDAPDRAPKGLATPHAPGLGACTDVVA